MWSVQLHCSTTTSGAVSPKGTNVRGCMLSMLIPMPSTVLDRNHNCLLTRVRICSRMFHSHFLSPDLRSSQSMHMTICILSLDTQKSAHSPPQAPKGIIRFIETFGDSKYGTTERNHCNTGRTTVLKKVLWKKKKRKLLFPQYMSMYACVCRFAGIEICLGSLSKNGNIWAGFKSGWNLARESQWEKWVSAGAESTDRWQGMDCLGIHSYLGIESTKGGQKKEWVHPDWDWLPQRKLHLLQ